MKTFTSPDESRLLLLVVRSLKNVTQTFSNYFFLTPRFFFTHYAVYFSMDFRCYLGKVILLLGFSKMLTSIITHYCNYTNQTLIICGLHLQHWSAQVKAVSGNTLSHQEGSGKKSRKVKSVVQNLQATLNLSASFTETLFSRAIYQEHTLFQYISLVKKNYLYHEK